MTNPRDDKLLGREIQTVTCDTGHTLAEYQQQKALFQGEFAKLVDKAVQLSKQQGASRVLESAFVDLDK